MRLNLARVVSVFASLCLSAGPLSAQTLRITTAEGWGADSHVSSSQRGPHGVEPVLRAAADPHEPRCEKIYLRFDLRRAAACRIVDAALILSPAGGDPFPQDLYVLGLRERRRDSAVLPAELWRELPPVPSTLKPGPLVWGAAPGHDPASLTGYRPDPRQKMPGMNGGVDVLGMLKVRADQPATFRFTSPQLAQFLDRDVSGVVTLILIRASRNAEPTLIASREHPHLVPPTLELTLQPRSVEEDVTRLSRFVIPHESRRETFETRWVAIARRAMTGGWTGCLADVDLLHEAMVKCARDAAGQWADQGVDLTRAFPDSDLAAVVQLSSMLRAEARLAAGQIDLIAWADAFEDTLRNSPGRAGTLIHALAQLSPHTWRQIGGGAFARLRHLQSRSLSARASAAVEELLDDLAAPSRQADAQVRAAWYARRILTVDEADASSNQPLVHPSIVRQLLTVDGKRLSLDQHVFPAAVHLASGRRDEASAHLRRIVQSLAANPGVSPLIEPVLQLLILEASASQDDAYVRGVEAVLRAHPRHSAGLLQAVAVLLGKPSDAGVPSARLLALLYGPIPAEASRHLMRHLPPALLTDDVLASPVNIDSAVRPVQVHSFNVALAPGSEHITRLLEAARRTEPRNLHESRRARHLLAALHIASGLPLPEDAADPVRVDVCLGAAHVLKGKSLRALTASADQALQGVGNNSSASSAATADLLHGARFKATAALGHPILLSRYVEALRDAGDEAAVEMLLDYLASVVPDASLGVHAALLRLAAVPEGIERDDLAISLYAARPDTAVGAALRPRYMQAMARRGHLLSAMLECDADGRLARAGNADIAAAILLDLVASIEVPIPAASPQIDIGLWRSVVSPADAQRLVLQLSRELLREDDQASAATLLLQACRRFMPRDGEWFDALEKAAAPAEHPALAALLMSLLEARMGQGDDAASRLHQLIANAPSAAMLPHLLLAAARVRLYVGDARQALVMAREAAALCPRDAEWSAGFVRNLTAVQPLDPPLAECAADYRRLSSASLTNPTDSAARLKALGHVWRLGYTHAAGSIESAILAQTLHTEAYQQVVASRILAAGNQLDPKSRNDAAEWRAHLTPEVLALPIRPVVAWAYFDHLRAAESAEGPQAYAALAAAYAEAVAAGHLDYARRAAELVAHRRLEGELVCLGLGSAILRAEGDPTTSATGSSREMRARLVEKHLSSPIARAAQRTPSGSEGARP